MLFASSTFFYLSGVLLPPFPKQPAIAAALVLLFCKSEKKGEAWLTRASHAQLHKCRRTESTGAQKPTGSSCAETHVQKGQLAPAVDGQWTWGLGLATVKRGTISCPSASKKSTQGTRANIFSTQIGYSNYPRLFNLATRLEALFQVPSANTMGGSGPGGHLSLGYITLAAMSIRG